MPFLVKNWKVLYSIDPRMDAVFKELRFTQSVTGEVSEAVHVFEFHMTDTASKELFRDILPKKIEELKTTPWTFTISDFTGEEKVTHTHILKSYRFKNALNDGVHRARFVLVSVELKALLNKVWVNQSWVTEGKMEVPIPDICERNGLIVDPNGIEPTDPVPEWGIIRQCNYTDLEFVRYHLVPRSANQVGEGGYDLWTKDGITAWYSTAGFGSKEATPDPAQILDLEELNESMQASFDGGYIFRVGGFDPFRKKPHNLATKAGIDEAYGNTGPSFDGSRFEYQPFATEKALRNWCAAHQGFYNENHYPFTVTLHGSTMVGDQKLVPPLVISLKGSTIRKPDDQRGNLQEILHTIRGGIYKMQLTCSRHKINY